LVEMLVDVVERPRLKNALEVIRLVGDQVAERDAYTRDRTLVERDQAVPKRTTRSAFAKSNSLSLSESLENIRRIPCHARTMVARPIKSREPNWRNSGSCVVSKLPMAC